MRDINLIVVHCSASQPSTDIGFKEIDAEHAKLGWRSPSGVHCGYHYIIRRSGMIEAGRPVSEVGAHAAPFNTNSIGICLVGGINAHGEPEKNFLPAQFKALGTLLENLRYHYPSTRILGHRDLSPDLNHDGKITHVEWIKACPCFDVAHWCRLNGIDPKQPDETPEAAVASIQ